MVPEELLRGELSESLLKVQTSLEILTLFRCSYEECRSNLDHNKKTGKSVKPWDFSPGLIFFRLDNFMNRIETIKV